MPPGLNKRIIILITAPALAVAAVQAVDNRPSESAVAGLWVNMWAATYLAAVHVFIHGPASIIHNCTAECTSRHVSFNAKNENT